MGLFKRLWKLSRKSQFFNTVFNTVYACDIPMQTKIGEGVHFPHGTIGTVISCNAVIGKNVCIQHHVLIGQCNGEENVPVIGDNVVINPYTCICGNVKIGDNSVIGVGSLVLHDVPPNTVFYNVRQDFSHPRDENMVL